MTYHGDGFEHIVHHFVFFSFKGRIYAVYHVVVGLLLLLLKFLEFLKGFLPTDSQVHSIR